MLPCSATGGVHIAVGWRALSRLFIPILAAVSTFTVHVFDVMVSNGEHACYRLDHDEPLR